MDISKLVYNICELFNKHAVDYMIIGGVAVGLHGYVRKSVTASGQVVEKIDMDLWYRPTHQNYYNLLKAVEELGKDVKRYRNTTFVDPTKSFFRFEFDEYTLDLLPCIKAPIKFSEAFARRDVFTSNGIEISLICLADLIQDKEVSPRPKDINDIRNLRPE